MDFCSSRQSLSNGYLVAKIGFDTAPRTSSSGTHLFTIHVAFFFVPTFRVAAIADSPLHQLRTLNTVVHVRVPVSHFLIGFTFLVQHFLLFSPAAQPPLFAIFDTFCILLYLVVPCFFFPFFIVYCTCL